MSRSTPGLGALAATIGLDLSDHACARLEQYAAEVVRWAPRLNLTAATPEQITARHVLDSLLPMAAWPIPHGIHMIDVGSGAGFPGIPIAIARGDLAVTLIESSRRRVAFLEHVRGVLSLDTLTVVWARASTLAHEQEYRDRFGCAVERAVARIAKAVELCLPFVAPGGAAVLIKGPGVAQDLPGVGPLITALGGRLRSASAWSMPGGRTTVPVVIVKERPTPPSFPRREARLGEIVRHGPEGNRAPNRRMSSE